MENNILTGCFDAKFKKALNSWSMCFAAWYRQKFLFFNFSNFI